MLIHSSEMHEATRRLLGVLLRQMDGFGPQSRSIIIGATNRRQDLDPALLSRFDATVSFGYPSEECRYRVLMSALFRLQVV
jgi:ATP-dependent 26S proteasome regulatory subunit